VVSLHGRDNRTPLWAALSRHGQAAVLTDAANSPAALAAAVADRAGDRFAMTVLEDLGLPGERVRRLDIEAAASVEASPLNLVVIEATRPPGIAPTLGLADDALLRADGVYTKPVARAVALSALCPRPGDVIFDIGAGVGTVAIEASLLNPGGPVFAVERDPARHTLLARNIRRTGALTVEPILGQAPQALAGLPDPDRVFVGGGLSGAPALLDVLAARLRPGGRLVVAAVLLGSIETARSALTRPGLTVLSQVLVQASQAAPLAGDWHYKADNPVCVLTASKEDR
jgi:precorrin-6Y C5,15-methyltransferase (decarboxylating)